MVMATGQLKVALALTFVLARTERAQARVLSAPPEPSLLGLTSDWARASSLGDLRELRASPDYLELRVWGGYGLGATQAVVLRRAGGRWSAFLARVRRCAIQIPIAVGETASAATMHGYVVEARRRCDTPLTDVGAGMRVITADTLAVDPLSASDSAIADAWMGAVRAGVLRLPGHVARGSVPASDFTYVVEVRQGNDYRASQIEYTDQPEGEADRQVREVYAAANRLLPPELVVKP